MIPKMGNSKFRNLQNREKILYILKPQKNKLKNFYIRNKNKKSFKKQQEIYKEIFDNYKKIQTDEYFINALKLINKNKNFF